MSTLKELIFDIGALFAKLAGRVFDWFLELSLMNKLVVVNISVCFFAIVLPMARYYIFDSWFIINNPAAVYLIGIIFVMMATIYLPNLYGLIIRIVLNLWYLLWILYIWASGSISHAPYEVSAGYYFNVAAPLFFMIPSALQYYLHER